MGLIDNAFMFVCFKTGSHHVILGTSLELTFLDQTGLNITEIGNLCLLNAEIKGMSTMPSNNAIDYVFLCYKQYLQRLQTM